MSGARPSMEQGGRARTLVYGYTALILVLFLSVFIFGLATSGFLTRFFGNLLGS